MLTNLCTMCKDAPNEALVYKLNSHGGLTPMCVDCAAELEEQAHQDYIAEVMYEDEVTNRQYTEALERDAFDQQYAERDDF